MAFTNVTVTGTFKAPNNVASSGTVHFQLTHPMKDTVSNQIAARVPVKKVLSSGAFTVDLYANDDTGVTPTGVQYEVTEEIDGVYRNYFISLSKDNTTVDLADL